MNGSSVAVAESAYSVLTQRYATVVLHCNVHAAIQHGQLLYTLRAEDCMSQCNNKVNFCPYTPTPCMGTAAPCNGGFSLSN